MRIFLERDTEYWINGKSYEVKSGEQEVDDSIAEMLVNAGYAKVILEQEKGKGNKR